MEAVEQAPQLGEVDLVDPVRPDVVDELAQPTDLVRDLDVCPAHGGHRDRCRRGSVRAPGRAPVLRPPHEAGPPRSASAGPAAPAPRPPMGSSDSRESATSWSRSMSRADGQVLFLEPLGEQGVLVTESDLGRAASQRPECVEDHGHIDDLLEDARPRRPGGDPTAATPIAARERPIPTTIALDGDPPGAPGNGRRLTQPVDPVDGEHHIGRFGCGGRPAGPEGHPDVGQGQCGCVVDPVPDHHGGRPAGLEPHQCRASRPESARPVPRRRRSPPRPSPRPRSGPR